MIKKPETTRNQTSLISLASCLRIAAALFALASSQPASSQTPAPNPNFEILSGATLDASTGIWTTTAGTQVTFLALDEGAYSEFEEQAKGSIEKGKLADLTVIEQDITTLPPREILSIRVLQTIVGGKVVYDSRLQGIR